MSFLVATYNVLAHAYIRADRYPRTPSALLRPEHRVPAVARRLSEIAADVVCLQEVERATFAAYSDHLAAAGYTGRFTQRPGGKPDGCAIFLRGPTSAWRFHAAIGLDAAGVRKRTHRIAQIACFDIDSRRLGIANAHLEWDPVETPTELQIAPRQVAQILTIRSAGHECAGWIVCGDFNTGPESAAVRAMRAAGFVSSHGDRPPPTCNANHTARPVDYLFYDHALAASPLPIAAVEDDTPLPGAGEPSDHVPVIARFSWTFAPSASALE